MSEDKFREDIPLLADGFNDAIIGYDMYGNRAVYSKYKMVEILMKDMSEEEATQYLSDYVKDNPDESARVQGMILGGMSHPAAIALAERLTALAPHGLTRAYFASDGASAVEEPAGATAGLVALALQHALEPAHDPVPTGPTKAAPLTSTVISAGPPT